MTEQIEQLNKMKAKLDKDKFQINMEVTDVRAATDEVARAKASAEKTNKNLQVDFDRVNVLPIFKIHLFHC